MKTLKLISLTLLLSSCSLTGVYVDGLKGSYKGYTKEISSNDSLKTVFIYENRVKQLKKLEQKRLKRDSTQVKQYMPLAYVLSMGGAMHFHNAVSSVPMVMFGY